MEYLCSPATQAYRPPRRRSWEALLAVGVAALLHAIGLFALVHSNAQLILRYVDTPGGELRVTLVAAPRQVHALASSRPAEQKPLAQSPTVTSRRQSAHTVSNPSPKPPERQPAAPVALTSPPTAESAAAPVPTAAAPAPVTNSLNLPGAQAVKTVSSVSCDIAQPQYPASARRLGHEGSVVLRVTIDPTGRITQADIAKSSGFEELDAAARQAMLAGHCEPYVDSGVPMTVHAMQPLTFSLDN